VTGLNKAFYFFSLRKPLAFLEVFFQPAGNGVIPDVKMFDVRFYVQYRRRLNILDSRFHGNDNKKKGNPPDKAGGSHAVAGPLSEWTEFTAYLRGNCRVFAVQGRREILVFGQKLHRTLKTAKKIVN
jgi:hypothetical protein